MKYLFLTDGSNSSLNALKAALRLIKNGAVIDVFSLTEVKLSFKKLYNAENSENPMLNLEEIIKKSKKIIEGHDHFLGDIFTEKGDEKKVIQHLDKIFYNMIILGSHNYKGLKNQFFSFARKIVAKSPCPIFVFRGEIQDDLSKKRKKILLCIDSTYQTLNAVISFMKNFNTDNDISLITVSADFFQHPLEISLSGNYVEEVLEKEAIISQKNLDEIEKILCNNNISVKSKIHLKGNPSEEILNFVKQDFNLLVLGSHSGNSPVDFLFGSVSKSILDYSISPVLIVPTKKF